MHYRSGTARLPRAARRNNSFTTMLVLAAAAGAMLALGDVMKERQVERLPCEVHAAAGVRRASRLGIDTHGAERVLHCVSALGSILVTRGLGDARRGGLGSTSPLTDGTLPQPINHLPRMPHA